MNPFDLGKAMTDFWSAQAKAMTGSMAQADEVGRANQALLDLWSGASALASQLATTVPGDPAMEGVLGKIMDPRQWMAGAAEGGDEMLGRMADGPRLADLWQVERRMAKVTQALFDVRRRALEHNAVLLKAWMEAGRAFSAAWAKREQKDGKDAVALWTETANTVLLATQRSDAFLTTQRETIRANTALRMAQRELAEYFGEHYGLPTRTELDDVHRTVTELRREVRALRRAKQGAQ